MLSAPLVQICQLWLRAPLTHILSWQVEEKAKLVCQPDGFYGPLTEREVAVRRASCHPP